MNIPEPRANTLLLGHDAAEATLLESLHSGRMHHAWLITGPDGVGKATLVYRFVRRLLSGSTEGETLALDASNPTFRRVAAGSHADLLTVERGYDDKRKRMRTQIAVDDVRRVTNFMSLTAAEGGWRAAVVDGAEDLNQASANALLKILEEPPPRAVLFLVCSSPGRLLPTIRSRCRRLRLQSLADATMLDLLGRYLPDLSDDERIRLVALAEGSVGRALLLAEDEGLAVDKLVTDVLAALPNLSPTRPYEVADALGRSDTAFSTFMELLRAGLAAAVRDAVRGRADPDQARLAGLRPVAAWGEIWQQLTKLQDETERFALDKRQAIVAGLGMLSGTLS